MTVKFRPVKAGETVPDDIARFRPLDGDWQPVLLGDVVLALIGDNCWVLPEGGPGGVTTVYMQGPGVWEYAYNMVSLLAIQTWPSIAKDPPKTVAGIDISGGKTWGGPVSWSFNGGDEVPDWVMSYEPLDPDTHVKFMFEGDVEVVDMEYATWILPRGRPAGTTAIKHEKKGDGKAKVFATRNLLWPTYVFVGFKDSGDGGRGPEPEPVDPTPPVTPVLEPA